MIKFFRLSYAIQYVVIALLAIALWIPAFMSGKVAMGLGSPTTPLFDLIDGWLVFSPVVQHILAFALLVFDTLFFNMMLVNNQIVGKVSTMGAFVFVVMMSLTSAQTNFYPFALSVPFIIVSINNLFDTYQLQKPEMRLFGAGISIAFASMCYFPSIIMVLWMLIALPVAKKGSLRLQLLPVSGFLMVYFVYFVVVYLFGDFLSLMHGYRDYFATFTLSVSSFSWRIVLFLLILIVPTLFLLFGSNNTNFEKIVAVRTKISMAVVLAILSIVLLFLGDNVLMNGLIFIALSILVSYAFSNLGNTGWADLFMVFFMIAVFANKYYFKWL